MPVAIDSPTAPTQPSQAAKSNNALRVLMLIPSDVKRGIEADVAAGLHPRMDYHELERVLREQGCSVDIRDYSSLSTRSTSMAVKDLRLASVGYALRRRYDVIFCNSESIALPLGAMLTLTGQKSRRPRIVAIGHRITPAKKRVFFTRLRAMESIDTLFLYAASQQRAAIESLGCPPSKVPLISFHADDQFFTPAPDAFKSGTGRRPLVSSAGLEWRDYPTLIEVARRMPEVDFNLAAASPWSKHANETERAALPPNVSARRYSYAELRDLYRASDCVALPLYDNDFQAGVTTLLEAMACGKPVIVTKTAGQTDVVQDAVNGFYAAPGDADAMEQAIKHCLSDIALRESIGHAANRWVAEHASLSLWADIVGAAIVKLVGATK